MLFMARHNIPVNDKELVIQRIAEGQSTREAITDTSIRSNSTAAQLAKEESNKIARYRQTYLFLMQQKFDVTLEDRAELWAAMAWAYKYQTIGYQPVKNSRTGAVTSVPIIDQVPDWRMRRHALLYMDQLDGITPPRTVSLNVMQQFNRNG